MKVRFIIIIIIIIIYILGPNYSPLTFCTSSMLECFFGEKERFGRRLKIGMDQKTEIHSIVVGHIRVGKGVYRIIWG